MRRGGEQAGNADRGVRVGTPGRRAWLVRVVALTLGAAVLIGVGGQGASAESGPPVVGALQFINRPTLDAVLTLETVSSGTRRGCPDSTTSATLLLAGPWSAEPIAVAASAHAMVGRDFMVTTDASLGELALAHDAPVVVGRYDLTLRCQDGLGLVYGVFLAPLWVTSPTTVQATDPRLGLRYVPTVTTFSFSPQAPSTVDAVVLTATVTAPVGDPEGWVVFGFLGSAPVVAGMATLTLPPGSLTNGSYLVEAQFLPVDDQFRVSLAGTQQLYVGFCKQGAMNCLYGNGEELLVTIDPGALTLTAATSPVDLGDVRLNADNTALESAPTDINPVTITDARAGGLGYTVSGIAGDFTSGGGGKITSENLGWTPKVVGTVPPSVALTVGPAVPPGDAIAPSSSGTPVAGLKVSRVLAATAGVSTGTVQVGATLALKAPPATRAGLYSTTLVITAI